MIMWPRATPWRRDRRPREPRHTIVDGKEKDTTRNSSRQNQRFRGSLL
jgi:hypothetical protein